jgi:outer membrane protein OmpA-like peptidoglycan-associated protein
VLARSIPHRRIGGLRTHCAVVAAVCSLVLAACSSGDTAADPAAAAQVTSSPSTAPATTPSAGAPVSTDPPTTVGDTVAVSSSEPAPADTAPAAPADPLDDLDEDGETDPTCGTADLGGGLIVETLCNEGLRPTPEGGVTPTPQSLLWLPAPPRWDDLADVDATARVATMVDGRRVVIYVLGSDTLFDSGSAALRSTSEPPLQAIVASLQARFPGSPVDVRGAADSVGDTAANQSLSEQRAATVAARLVALGVPAGLLSSQGLGELVPAAEEAAADGSISEPGRQVNRRVEIVVG